MTIERLGLTVIPAAGWRADDVRRIARDAEQAGFAAIFSTEVNSDTMATALLMGCSTERIELGTWVANIYLRHPFLCAKGAELIADATDGRFRLGLGVSHQPVNAALQIDMRGAGGDLSSYARAVRGWLDGQGPTTHLPQRPAPRRVPIYVAALSFAAVERAAEVADGLMPTMWSPERVAESHEHIVRGRRRAPEARDIELTLGLPTFIGENVAHLRAIARENLALYTGFPFFRRMWRESGFAEEVEAMERGAGSRALSDDLLDAVCLIGPPSRCRERIARYRSVGVDLPILMPAVGPRAASEVIDTFATVLAQ